MCSTSDVTYKDHKASEEILCRTCSRKLADVVTERRFQSAGERSNNIRWRTKKRTPKDDMA